MKNLNQLDEAWRLFPHTFAEYASSGRWQPYPYLKMISREIVEAVRRGNGRLIVELPPRHGKSQLISYWTPVWYLNLFPEKNVILSSYETDFAGHWGRLVRNEIATNPLMKIRLCEDSTATYRWETTEGGGMVATGIGGPLSGRGFSLGIVDDPVKNWEEATSPTYRKRTIEWFTSTFLTRAEPNATIIVLMTRWHEDDLAGWLEREHGDTWKTLRFPALAEPGDPLGRIEGDALCPERFSEDALGELKKALGSRVWASLYQQRPSPEEGSLIKRQWFRFYEVLPGDLQEQIISCDLAFKDGADSSYVVLQCWGRKGANRYLIDQVRQKLDFIGTLEAIRRFRAKYSKVRALLVEDKANGPSVISTLKNEISGVIPVTPKGSKESRATSVSPVIEAGNVYLPSPSLQPWVNEFIEECATFPGSRYSDQIDSMTQALSRFEEKKVIPLRLVFPDFYKPSVWNR